MLHSIRWWSARTALAQMNSALANITMSLSNLLDPSDLSQAAAPEAAAPEADRTNLHDESIKLRDESIKLRDESIKLVQLVLQLVFIEARVADPKEGHKILVKVPATSNSPRAYLITCLENGYSSCILALF